MTNGFHADNTLHHFCYRQKDKEVDAVKGLAPIPLIAHFHIGESKALRLILALKTDANQDAQDFKTSII
ncbi:hypothetical protein BM451_09680 [Dickeya dadantii]|nr:hypothetical protein [Dickeya dadantii]OOC13736.1 hypothetical protein BM451_09680 [Dickeya dadantii]